MNCLALSDALAASNGVDAPMATINWKSPVSGLWSSKADWTGGIVPGAGDSAVIADSGTSSPYTISVATPVTVASLTLDDPDATLAIDKALSASNFVFDAGLIALHAGSSLTGTVTFADTMPTLATVNVFGTATLNNVVWNEGNAGSGVNFTTGYNGLPPTLIIEGGLQTNTATGSRANVAIYVPVVLDDVASLNDQYLRTGPTSLIDTPDLTLGAQEQLFTGTITASAGETITNLGNAEIGAVLGASIDNAGTMILRGTLAGGSVTNTGTLEFSGYPVDEASSFAPQATSLYNDGTILTSGELDLSGVGTLQAAGTNGKIVLDSGILVLRNPGSTKALLQEVEAQHVSGKGLWSVGISGTLNNTGATLTVGTATMLGEFGGSEYWGQSGLSGGTLVLADRGTEYLDLNVSGASIDSNGSTLLVSNASLIGDTISGVSTIVVSEWGGGFPSDLAIGDTSFSSGTVNFVIPDGTVTFDGDQSLAGDTITVSSRGTVDLGTLSTNGVTFDVKDFDAYVAYSDVILGTGGLSSSTVVNLEGGGALLDGIESNSGLIHGSTGGVELAGTFTNTGTISLTGANLYTGGPGTLLDNSGTITLVGGTLTVSPTQVVNTGKLSITNGTLQLVGPLNVASLSAIAHPGSYEEISGAFSLGGKLVCLDTGYNPKLSLVNGEISDGTLAIRAGQSFSATATGTDSSGQAAALISANILNNGTLSVSSYYSNFAPLISGSVSGTGTITIVAYSQVGISGEIGAHQTLVFGNLAEFGLVTQASETGFKGTLAGFAKYDVIALAGTVTSAGFAGSSVVATLSNGTTLALHTASALTGSLSVSQDGSLSLLTYESTTSPAAQDWISPGAVASYSSEDNVEHAFLDLHAAAADWHPFLNPHSL
jgi:hypothetical protein